MHFIYGLLILVFVIALMANPTLGDGWYWELGNGLGFVCFAALLYLTFEGRSNSGGRSKYHRQIAYAALITLFAHGLWFLLGDPVSVEYIKFSAPFYMVFGIGALAIGFLLVFSSITSARQKAYTNRASFRVWHRVFAYAMVGLSALHIGFSGYYIQNVLQVALLTISVLAVIFIPTNTITNHLHHIQIKNPTNRAWFGLILFVVVILAMFVLLRTGISE